jgi:hypothetical protein
MNTVRMLVDQKHQRHVVFSAIQPPAMGPTAGPNSGINE